MKAQIFLSLFFLFLVPAFTVQAEDALSLYLSKEYEQAEKTLLETVKTKGHDPLVYYNLGVTAEKQGKRGYAVYYYLQALQMAPHFQEAQNNLQIIMEHDQLKIPQMLKTFSGDLTVAIILSLISLYLFVFLLIYLMFRPDWKVKIALIPSFLIMVLFTSLFFYRYRDVQSQNYAVVFASSELKSGPDEALSSIGSLKPGEILIIRDFSSGWAKTKSFRDNNEGWVSLKHIHPLIRRAQ